MYTLQYASRSSDIFKVPNHILRSTWMRFICALKLILICFYRLFDWLKIVWGMGATKVEGGRGYDHLLCFFAPLGECIQVCIYYIFKYIK